MIAKDQIELLTNRAMNLNEIELKNKKYKKEIQEIIIKKDKAEKEVEIEKSRTRYEKIKAEKTLMQLEEEKSVRYNLHSRNL